MSAAVRSLLLGVHLLEQTFPAGGDGARLLHGLGHRLAPGGGAEREAGRLALRVLQGWQLLATEEAGGPAALAPHVLAGHLTRLLAHAGLQVRAVALVEGA